VLASFYLNLFLELAFTQNVLLLQFLHLALFTLQLLINILQFFAKVLVFLSVGLQFILKRRYSLSEGYKFLLMMVDSQFIFRIGHIAPSFTLSFVRVYDWYYLSALYSLLIEALSLVFLSH